MNKKVFIDGRAGTTGLRIFERLAAFPGIEITELAEADRKNTTARKKALNEADIAFLCLPDEAAKESVELVENDHTVILDTSTAHRTAPGWVYGFPELSGSHRESVRTGKRIAVPGCHASGFIALVFPLVEAGLLDRQALLSCFSLTGYSGGGKKMIAQYEHSQGEELLSAPRQYGLSQTHKHLAEMQKVTGLDKAPAFCPVVAPFYSGMEVTVPIFSEQLTKGAGKEAVAAVYREKYTGEIVRFCPGTDEEGFLSAAALSGRDSMQLALFGNEDRLLPCARYDNLGKGASGAAIECLNLVLGFSPTNGLTI